MKRKKHPRLPSGYGSIRYLGKNRRNPYAVHPPATLTEAGYSRPKAICYVRDWYTAFAVLTAYRNGSYTPGMEYDIQKEVDFSDRDLDDFCMRVLRTTHLQPHTGVSFGEAYNLFIEWKFGENAPRKLSEKAKNAYMQGFKHLSAIKDRPIKELTVNELQSAVNNCDRKKATKENIVLCIKNVYKYALAHDLCEKDNGRFVIVPDAEDDEHGIPFTEDEIKLLWENKTDPVCEFLLIMCYSGFRISAFLSLTVNLEEKYFQGGVKTSTNRIVPIHSKIFPLVETRIKREGCLLKSVQVFRKEMYARISQMRMNHTPHDCRHTFSWLCQKFGVNELDRKRMLGHSFSDVTNSVYGHRTVEELRKEIEKIDL